MVYLIDPSNIILKKCPKKCDGFNPACSPHYIPLYGIDPIG